MAERKLNIDEMCVDGLKEELRKLNLQASGSKAVLRERLRTAIRNKDGSVEKKSGDEEEDERDGEENVERDCEDDESDDSSSDDEEDVEDVVKPVRGRTTATSVALSFKDVEDSLQIFSGDAKQNVRKWIEDFEETCEVCQWSEAQKIIYAKKLLRGSAKLFVSYEKCATTWKKFKKSLIKEFSRIVNSKTVHKELARAEKRSNESFHEFMYRMMEMASHADIEFESKIQYIIEGIPDDPVNKSILYGARSINGLRKRLTQYETMKNNQRSSSRGHPMKIKKDTRREGSQMQHSKPADVKRCFNCGEADHLSRNCPTKERGTKCFRCGQRGHISTACPERATMEATKGSNLIEQPTIHKSCKTVRINNSEIIALVDTGSDLTLMRADCYVKIGAPRLENSEIIFRGIGSSSNKTLGKFSTNVFIDGESYWVTIYVISDVLMKNDLLLGVDFLNTVNVLINEGTICIQKVKNEFSINGDISEICYVEHEEECNGVDLAHITSAETRNKIQRTISNYIPAKTREVNVKMNIVLKDDEPVYQRARRLAPTERDIVNTQLAEWIREGIIQPSLSEYTSPIVLVKKKDSSARLCVDYRKLNQKVVKDRYPLPLIEDILDALQGAKLFSTLDLKNGFFHVWLSDDSRKFTSFIVPDGQYEFLRVPFGLCNSPAVFAKFINAVFRELINKKIVLAYMDDLIIPSNDMETGMKNLETVLTAAKEFGLDINWKKCKLLQTKVEFLGHILENGSIRPSENKTSAVMKFAKPTTIKQVQSFLGLTGYFRKFIRDYSLIARPLTDLLRANVKFEFGPKEMNAFEVLKARLCAKPVLKLYDVNAETELHTDASMFGFGAILLQRDEYDGKMHPVYFASGKTTPAEAKYTSYELEVLAVVKCLKKFRIYLLGIKFKIVTDCKAFSLTMSKRDLCVRVARWALLLEEFDYSIEHRAGSKMAHVDALSRNPLPSCLLISDSGSDLTARIQKAQHDDEKVRRIFELAEQEKIDGYLTRGGLLFKMIDDDIRLVVPKKLQSHLIRRIHGNGHFSIAKTEALLKKDYWFQGIRPKIGKTLQNCVDCILAERKTGKQEGFLIPIDKGEVPLDTYHVDHLGPLPSTKKSYRYILVVVDAFTKFVWLYTTKTTSTSEVLRHLNKQAVIFGNPRRIISDRGTAFTSGDFQDYCKKENIQHSLIATGVPRGNGQVERVNRTLIPLLTKLSAPRPEEWYRHLDAVQRYLNAIHHRSIKTTPFHLFFGTRMRTKDDLQIRELLEQEWAAMFQEGRNEARTEAKENIAKIQEENRKVFNKKRKEANKYCEDDLVAIKRSQLGPGLKLAAKYLGPYRIAKALRNDRYMVEKVGNHEGPFQTSTAVDHMKPWISENMESTDGEDDSEEESPATTSEDGC